MFSVCFSSKYKVLNFFGTNIFWGIFWQNPNFLSVFGQNFDEKFEISFFKILKLNCLICGWGGSRCGSLANISRGVCVVAAVSYAGPRRGKDARLLLQQTDKIA